MTRSIRCFLFAFALFCCAGVVRAQSQSSYEQAEILVHSGQVDQAIVILRELLQSEPQNLKGLNLLGIALTTKGDLTAANQEYNKALRIDPRFVPALKNLAVNELSEKHFSDAQRHLAAALALAPADPMIHAQLGKLAYSRHDYRSAASHLEQSGDLLGNPELASLLIESELEVAQQQRAVEQLRQLHDEHLSNQTRFSLGLSLARHGLYQEAIPFFQRVSAAYPESYDGAFNLAICYVQTKQFAVAVETLRALADRGKKTAELDNLLAEAYLGNDQVQPAIDALREATKLAPEDENNYIDLATLCTNNDAYDLGLQIIEVGLHYHPKSDRLIFQRGVIEAMTNHFDLADRDFQLASSLAPEKNLSYVGQGVSYLQRGDVQQAIKSLRQRTKTKPNDAILQYLLGEALIRSGASPGDDTFDEARVALEKSVKLNPKFPAAQVDLGKIYLKENRLDEALKHLEQARTIDPKDRSAYSQLAIAYRRKGNSEMAATMLAQLNKLNDEERSGNKRQRLQIVSSDSATMSTQPN